MSEKSYCVRVSRKRWLRGGAYQAVDMYKQMSQASRKGGMFEDVMRHAKLWAEKQTSSVERREAKRAVRKGGQAGLF